MTLENIAFYFLPGESFLAFGLDEASFNELFFDSHPLRVLVQEKLVDVLGNMLPVVSIEGIYFFD